MSARRILLFGAMSRTVYGLLSLFAPKVIFSRAGMDELPADTRYFNGLFGGRDLTVAGLTVAALKAGRDREALLANVSCEATDSVALVQELRHRGEVDQIVAAAIAFNAFFWLCWALAARAIRG